MEQIDSRIKEFEFIAILENIDEDILILNKSLNSVFKNDNTLKMEKNVNEVIYTLRNILKKSI